MRGRIALRYTYLERIVRREACVSAFQCGALFIFKTADCLFQNECQNLYIMINIFEKSFTSKTNFFAPQETKKYQFKNRKENPTIDCRDFLTRANLHSI